MAINSYCERLWELESYAADPPMQALETLRIHHRSCLTQLQNIEGSDVPPAGIRAQKVKQVFMPDTALMTIPMDQAVQTVRTRTSKAK